MLLETVVWCLPHAGRAAKISRIYTGRLTGRRSKRQRIGGRRVLRKCGGMCASWMMLERRGYDGMQMGMGKSCALTSQRPSLPRPSSKRHRSSQRQEQNDPPAVRSYRRSRTFISSSLPSRLSNLLASSPPSSSSRVSLHVSLIKPPAAAEHIQSLPSSRVPSLEEKAIRCVGREQLD
jgi:hypothetical protein